MQWLIAFALLWLAGPMIAGLVILAIVMYGPVLLVLGIGALFVGCPSKRAIGKRDDGAARRASPTTSDPVTPPPRRLVVPATTPKLPELVKRRTE